MWSVLVSGLATGALFAATALVYNVMFSTSKVLSITTGHIAMLGGVFGAWFITGLGLPWIVGLAGAVAVGAAFGWLTDVLAIRRVLARSDEHLWLLSTLALATMVQQAVGLWWGTEPKPFPRLIPQDFSAGIADQKFWLPIAHRHRDGAGPGALLSPHDVRQALPGDVGRRVRGAGARRPDRPDPVAVLRDRRRDGRRWRASPPAS